MAVPALLGRCKWREGGCKREGRGRNHNLSTSDIEFDFHPFADEDDFVHDYPEDPPLACSSHDYANVGDSLQCIICSLTATDAQQVDGKIYCQSCLAAVLKESNNGSPNCRIQSLKTCADKRSKFDSVVEVS